MPINSASARRRPSYNPNQSTSPTSSRARRCTIRYCWATRVTRYV